MESLVIKNNQISSEYPEDIIEFVRYKIRTKLTPPRYKLPTPFIPKIGKTGLAKLIIQEIYHFNFKLVKKDYRKLLFSRPCIYGVFSGRFGGFRPRVDLCTGCMRCVLEYPSFCTINRNKEYTLFADSFWSVKYPTKISSSPFATVWFESETGKIPIRGMGYQGTFSDEGWDSIWTDMSEIVRPTRDGVYGREYISTICNIGRKAPILKFPIQQTYQTIDIPIPIIFDYRPSNLDNDSIRASVSKASKQVQTLFVADPKYYESNDNNSYFIPLVSVENYQKYETILQKTKCIEFIDDGSDLFSNLKLINPEVPIIARLPFSQNTEERAIELVNQGVAGLHLCANYHGKEYQSNNPRFIKDLIRSIHTRLIEKNIRDQITIIVSGGIILAEHIPKAIICGADLVAIDTTVLVALQIKFDGECESAETGTIIEESFDTDWGSQRLINLLGSWHNQLIEILSAMGMRDVRRLSGDTGRALFKEDLEKEAFRDITKID